MSYFDDNEDRIIYGSGDILPRIVECRKCGAGGLEWGQEADGRYILVSSKTGRVHKCDERRVHAAMLRGIPDLK